MADLRKLAQKQISAKKITSSNPDAISVGIFIEISRTTIRHGLVQANLPANVWWEMSTNQKTEERLELAAEHLRWSRKYGQVLYGGNNSFLNQFAIVSKRIYFCFIT